MPAGTPFQPRIKAAMKRTWLDASVKEKNTNKDEIAKYNVGSELECYHPERVSVACTAAPHFDFLIAAAPCPSGGLRFPDLPVWVQSSLSSASVTARQAGKLAPTFSTSPP